MATDNINDIGTNAPVVTTTQSQATYPQNTPYTDPVYKDTASDPATSALALALDKKAAAKKNLDDILNAQSDSGNYDEVARKKAQAELNAADAEVVKKAEASSKSHESQTFTEDQLNKDLTAGKAPSKPGTTTNDDASPTSTKSGTNTIYNAATTPGSPTAPRDNVLDQYASYTYGLSLYLLTADQYKQMASTSKINTNEWSLLIQTGGAPPPVVPAAPPPPKPAPSPTQTKPVTASYNSDGTVNANDANAYGAG